MNYGLIIFAAIFLCTNCIYLKRYKRFKETDFISTANKIIASCHSCGDSPLILDVLRSTKEVFNSKEQDYEKVFELNKCAKTTVLEKGKIEDSPNFKTFGEEAKAPNSDSTKLCQSLKDLEKEFNEKMMEFCNDKNTAVIKSLLANIRYSITVDKDIAYSSIYECL
uniref:Lipoprotein n=1 Tax=Panagrolaimus sp. ES5 TaxID=591445 RepID=A0AC34FEH2_9BILA